MDLQKAIKNRHSTRKFSSKTPDWRDIIECVDSSRFAPMSGNIFTPKFIFVENKENIQKISDATTQDFVSDAKYIVVVCSDPSQTRRFYDEAGEKYNEQQVGAAIQNFLLSIEEKGLATCWVGYFVDDMVRKILKIPEKIKIEAIFPIGYENTKPRKKQKTELDQCLFFGKYGTKTKNPPKKLDA